MDIFLSHEWPQGVYHHGNVAELLRKKPYFREEVMKNELGAAVLTELMGKMKPRHWFAAHMHVGFEATVKYENSHLTTKFVALDKCLPNRDYLRVF